MDGIHAGLAVEALTLIAIAAKTALSVVIIARGNDVADTQAALNDPSTENGTAWQFKTWLLHVLSIASQSESLSAQELFQQPVNSDTGNAKRDTVCPLQPYLLIGSIISINPNPQTDRGIQ